MDSLLTVPQKRQLELLSLINDHPTGIELAHALKILQISESIFYEDVKDIEEHLSDINIQVKNGILSSPQCKLNHFNTLQRIYVHNLLEFKILIDLFFADYSLDDMISKYFISSSSLYRAVKRLNDLISHKYDLKISTNPFSITGDERSVRLYYFNIFFQYFDDYFAESQVDLDFSWVINMIDFFNLSVSLGTVLNLKYFYYINLERTCQGHYLTLEESKITEELLEQQSPMISYIRSLWQVNLEYPFDRFHVEQILFPYSESFIIIDPRSAKEYLQAYPELKKSYEILDETVTLLAERFNINIQNKAEILRSLHNNTYMQNYMASSTQISFDHSGHFMTSIRTHYPEFYKEVYLLFYPYYERFKQASTYDYFINVLLQTMFFIWFDLNKFLSEPPKAVKILVISSINLIHAELIKDCILRYYDQLVDVTIYKEKELDHHAILHENYDIIITNFVIEPIGRALHLVSADFPGVLDYTKLNDAVNRIFANYIRIGIS